MDLQELRQEAIKIIKANPELKSEIQDLFSLAISEVEEGGSESHECDLAYNDMIELQNEANNNKMVRGGKLTEKQQAKFDKVMSEWKDGKLHSGSSDGPIVKDQDQAIAIAYAEANAMKKMEFGGLVYDSLSDEAKDRMDGLVPTEQINNVLSNCRYIVSQMMEEGFELDEAISFIVYKIVDDFTDKRMGYFSDEYYPEDWKQTANKPSILVDLYNKLLKAKNLKSLQWGYDEDEGHYLTFENGLESESDYHKGELESYSFYVDEDDRNKLLVSYDLSGNTANSISINDALKASRANFKEYSGGGFVENDQIEEYAEAIYEDLRQEYKPYELQNMSMEEAMMSVDSYDDVPENLKEEVASYLMNMASQNEFFEEDMYNKGGVIENKMQSLENELNKLESELKWTQQQNGASKQYYLRKRRSGKMTRERAMELIDQSNASWKKEREKVREKIKEVKDRIKRLEELSSKVNADQFADGGGVDGDDDVYFATVINKKDPNYNRLAYSKSAENTKDKYGNEFDKLYFENKKTPLKYNVKDLNYNVRKIHDFKDVQGRKFMLLKELQKDKTLYYYIVHSGDKKVYTESGNMNAIKEYLKNLTNGKDFYSKPGINFANGGGVDGDQ